MLVTTFNQMLDQIQAQNRELEEARAELETAGGRAHPRPGRRQQGAGGLLLLRVARPAGAAARDRRLQQGAARRPTRSRSTSRGRHYLDRVRAATQRMSRAHRRPARRWRGSSRQELVRREVDVSALAQRVAAELARRDADRAVRGRDRARAGAQADPQLLAIVLENLMGNAWKFTGKAAERPHRGRPGRETAAARRLLRARQRGGVRHGLCGQAVRRLPAPAPRRRLRGHGHRPRHRAADRDPPRRPHLGGGRGRARARRSISRWSPSHETTGPSSSSRTTPTTSS